MAYKTQSGIVLRNPSEKAKRYARQMKSGVVRETGQKLTNTDMAYRAGYLDARQDSANAYNANKKNKKNNQIFDVAKILSDVFSNISKIG